LAKLRESKEVHAYEDVYSNPLLAENCAEAIWKIIERSIFEVFNVAGKDVVSIFQLLQKTAEVFELDRNLVKPVKQGFFKELVGRPKNTSYDVSKMQKVLDLPPLGLDLGLKHMKDREIK
jgi:dTDP-4-dehydrorhamnose reductase